MMTQRHATRYFYNVDSDNETRRVLSTSPVVLSCVIITAGGGAAAARIYDSAAAQNGDPTTQSFLVSVEASNSMAFYFDSMQFKKGLTVIIEQGQAFGAECACFYD